MRSIPAIDIYIVLLVRFYILDAYKAFDQLTACIEATPPEVPSQESHDTRAAFVDKLAAKHSVDKQVHIGNISLTQIVDTVRDCFQVERSLTLTLLPESARAFDEKASDMGEDAAASESPLRLEIGDKEASGGAGSTAEKPSRL